MIWTTPWPRGEVLRAAVALAFMVLGGCGQGEERGLDFEYYRSNVEPLFVQARGDFQPADPGDPACVMCHTWQTNTAFHLESLQEDADGAVAWTEEQSRSNFEVVSRLVSPRNPDTSRLLLAPLAAGAGGNPFHTGGKVWASKDDAEWQVLAEWVNTAEPGTVTAEPVPDVDFAFFRACVQPIFIDGTPGGLACATCHDGGPDGFAEAPAEGFTWTEDESRERFELAMRLIEPGQPTQSRLLMHPLHPDGGGDYAHNGVRRWMSQDDPEWQMLAAWVRGERTGADCQR